MSGFIHMEDEEIIYHVYNLNWHLPEETQKEAADILLQLPADKVRLIIPKYGKACWENGVAVIRKIGYPRNENALQRLEVSCRTGTGLVPSTQLRFSGT